MAKFYTQTRTDHVQNKHLLAFMSKGVVVTKNDIFFKKYLHM